MNSTSISAASLPHIVATTAKALRGRVLAALLLCLLAVQPSQAEDYEYGAFSHYGLQIGFSTEGFTAGIGTTLSPFFELGVNVNYMPAFTISGNMKLVNNGMTTTGIDDSQNRVRVSGDLRRLTFDAKLNVYPFGPGTTFFLAGGVSVGGKKLVRLSGHSDFVKDLYDQYGDLVGDFSAVIDEYTLKLAKNGDVEGDIRLNNVRPYVGLGFGRMVPKKGVGVRIEAGVQFSGKLKVYQGGSQVDDKLVKSALDSWTGDDRLSKLVDKMNVYPVLKLTLTGGLF